MPELHETMRGRRVFDVLLPRAVEALESIAKELKRANDLKENKKEKASDE